MRMSENGNVVVDRGQIRQPGPFVYIRSGGNLLAIGTWDFRDFTEWNMAHLAKIYSLLKLRLKTYSINLNANSLYMKENIYSLLFCIFLKWQNVGIIRKNSNSAILSAEERSGQRIARDLADLQAHEALQEDHTFKSEDTPAEVPSCDLRVSWIFKTFSRRTLIVSQVSLCKDCHLESQSLCLNQKCSNNPRTL